MKFFLKIKNLNANKGHGWGKILIRMIKLRRKQQLLQSNLYLAQCQRKVWFPMIGKKSMQFQFTKETPKN